MQKILNIAHRGFSSKYPENTMIAFKKAIEVGADGMEFDVQLTKDGELLIIHDETLDRTTTGKGLVKDYTLKEIKEFDAGVKFDEKFKGEKIPTLDELFSLVEDSDLILNLEIKNSIINYEEIEEKVYEKIKEYRLEKNVVVSSFNHYSMIKFKKLDKNIKVGALYDACLYEPFKYGEEIGVDALHPEFHSINNEIVLEAHKRNLEVNVYTVNSKEDMERMISVKVDMIITNNPDILKSLIEVNKL